MLALLNDQPILVLMATVALGAAVGTIPLGKIRLGASGALFVGLLVGAVLPDVGDRLALFQSFGLALFAYLIGLGAGKVFFRDLRRNLPLMLAAVVVVILTAFTVHPLAALLNLDLPTAIGVWTGSLTATPAMALANQLTGGQAPAVGYGLSYLVGVVGTIIAITLLAARPWSSSPRDPAPVTDGKLRFTAAAATSALAVREIPGIAEGWCAWWRCATAAWPGSPAPPTGSNPGTRSSWTARRRTSTRPCRPSAAAPTPTRRG